MSDRYAALVNSGLGRRVAPKLGLPRPAVLRRYSAGPVLPGPALVIELGASRLGPALAAALAAAGVALLERSGAGSADETERPAAIVIDATGADTVAALGDLPALVSPALRRLRSSGRIVVVGVRPGDGDDPATAAARQALDGFVRSLAKEARAGATANLVYIAQIPPADAALESTLRFLLSGRSAYVDGQPIVLGPGAAPAPADWAAPLAGRTAVVTGAARGIGASIVATLARDGARVVCVDLPAAGEALTRVANRVSGTTLQLDIAGPDAPGRLAEYLARRHGGVDIVVHNAGITRDRLLANMKPDRWTSVLDINLGAQLRINEALIGQGTLRPGARIVCLSSTSGIAGNRGQTNYAASKAGIIGLVRATAPRLADRDATINAVAPGFIDTEMTARMPFATREVARRLNSLVQAGQPVDVAEAVAWLASPGAGAVTGQVLRVCGQNLVGA